jgi:hypothetical protein
MAATKDELKNMLVSLVNLKVSSEDITEIDITLKTKMSSITLVEKYESVTVPSDKEPVVETPVVTPTAEPIALPVKERKKRVPKSPVEVVETPVSTLQVTPSVAAAQPVGAVTSFYTKPTGTARIVKLVTFFCKGQNINPSDITIALLKEKAFDIIEGYEDAVVQTAIDEFKKANVK